MDWITRDIAISGYQDFDPQFLESMGVSGMVQMIRGFPKLSSSVTVCMIPVSDMALVDSEVFEKVHAFICSQHREGGKVLVSCAMGISRSTTMVFFHLISMGYEPEEALALIWAKRPQASPHPLLVASALHALSLPADQLTVRKLLIPCPQSQWDDDQFAKIPY